MTGGRYEAVIGLEIHVQLRTTSKIFCACSTGYGAAPNSQVCPVCLGHPGVLPVLNREAVSHALRFGLAVDARIARQSRFARKHYFYPDLPKGYQISQYERPVLAGGALAFPHEGGMGSVRLVRAHLEEDAGKSVHMAADSDRDAATLVDLNRCGVPLLEVVTEPDLRSPAEARDFFLRLRQLVVYLGICDGNMEEGSLRCDANVSLRAPGETALNPKTEIKNLNSFRHVERALAHEIERQTAVFESGGTPEQATRLWDEGTGATRVMRTKEDAPDYRYFPEPDLPPLAVDETWIAAVRETMPELPEARERRLAAEYGITADDAVALAATPELADYFEGAARSALGGGAAETTEAAVRAATGTVTANWIRNEILRLVKETPGGLSAIRVRAADLGRLVRMVVSSEVSASAAKTVLEEMAATGRPPGEIVEEKKLRLVHDPEGLRRAVAEALDAHPDQVEQYLDGKDALVQFFVGRIMKALGGRAEPRAAASAVREALEERRQAGR